jgi:hypothetical protein
MATAPAPMVLDKDEQDVLIEYWTQILENTSKRAEEFRGPREQFDDQAEYAYRRHHRARERLRLLGFDYGP